MGEGPVGTINDCTKGRIFFAPSYDPVRRELVLRDPPADDDATAKVAQRPIDVVQTVEHELRDRKSTRLNSSHH